MAQTGAERQARSQAVRREKAALWDGLVGVTSFEVGRLELEPGDVLVARVAGAKPEQLEHVGQVLRHLVGPRNRVLTADETLDLAVLTRAEIEERAR